MQKTRFLLLILAVSFFAISKAQTTTTNTTIQAPCNISVGLRVNATVFQKIAPNAGGGNTIFTTDYSAYLQYKGIGFFGGLTALNNYNNGVLPSNQNLNCFNIGLFFRLDQANKNSAVYLYLYNLHYYNQLNPTFVSAHYSNGTFFPSAYYNQTIDFLCFNPRYRYSFLNQILSLELGISFSAIRNNIVVNQSTDNSISLHPAIGGNFSLAFNLAALFQKNK